jgi:hypothetical protein
MSDMYLDVTSIEGKSFKVCFKNTIDNEKIIMELIDSKLERKYTIPDRVFKNNSDVVKYLQEHVTNDNLCIKVDRSAK